MLTIDTFRTELRQFDSAFRQFNQQLSRQSSQAATSLSRIKREMQAIRAEADRMYGKQIKLRVDLDDRASQKLSEVKQTLQGLQQSGQSGGFAESVDKFFDSVKRLQGVANTFATITVGGNIGGIMTDVEASYKELGLYAARGKDQQEIEAFKTLANELTTRNPYLSKQEAMALIARSEQLAPEDGAAFAKQAATLGVTTRFTSAEAAKMMGTLSKTTGVEDAERLADAIQYMSNNLPEFTGKHMDVLLSYSKQAAADPDMAGKLDTPEKLAAMVVEMDKRFAGQMTGQDQSEEFKAIANNIAAGAIALPQQGATQTAYQSAFDADSLLAYKQAQNEARQSLIDLGMTVADDVAPVLKELSSGVRSFTDFLNGMPDWARIGLELGVAAVGAAGALTYLAARVVTLGSELRNIGQMIGKGRGTAAVPDTSPAPSVGGNSQGKGKGKATVKGKGNIAQPPKAAPSSYGGNEAGGGHASSGKSSTKTSPSVSGKAVATGPKQGIALETDLAKAASGSGGWLRKGLRRLPFVGAALGGVDILQSENKLETAARVGSQAIGGWGGTVAGAAVGAAVGSVVPLVGTAVGGVVGGLIGGIGGSMAGDYLFDKAKSWWQDEPKPSVAKAPARVSSPASPVGLTAPQISPAARTQETPRSVSLTIPQITIPLHVGGVLQDVPTMLKMLNDPTVGQRIQRIVEKALLDALETRGGVAT